MNSPETIKNWQAASEIYARMSDLSVGEAMSQLETLEHITPAVRQLVITLINAGNQASVYIDENVTPYLDMEKNVAQQSKAGDTLNQYTLIEELGRGGMSQVFLAERNDAQVQKKVAIKIFSPRFHATELLSHFVKEQSILAELSHPNIVSMQHGGETQDGTAYLIMELIDGARPIDDYVREEHLDTRAIIRLVLSAAEALAYAHANLTIHRDLKPCNILVDRHGVLKIVDFGIAKLIQQDPEEDKTTLMALTPSFAAPEQIKSERISVSSDVFSLAAVTTGLLLGKAPLPEDRLLRACQDDEDHVRSALRQSGLDRDLCNVLNKALKTEPSQRYSSMQSLADDLQRWVNNEPVSATSDSVWYQIRKFAQRRSALFAALLTLLVSLLLGMGLVWRQYNLTVVEAEKFKQVKEFMLDVFSVTNPDTAQGERIFAVDLLSQARSDISTRDFPDPLIKAELLGNIGTALSRLGVWERAESSINEALALDPDNTEFLLQQAYLQLNKDDTEAAETLLDRLSLDEDSDPILRARLYTYRGILLTRQKKYDEAVQWLQRGRELFQQANDTEGMMSSAIQLATVEFETSHTDRAIEVLEQAHDEFLPQVSSTNSKLMELEHNMMQAYNDVGDYEKSLQLGNELVDKIREVLGNKHPSLQAALSSLAGSYRAHGQIDQALELAGEAHQLSVFHFGLNHQYSARTLNMLAILAYEKGDFEQAIHHMQDVVKVFTATLGADHQNTWDTQVNLAVLLDRTGRSEEARAILEPLYDKLLEQIGADHRSTLYLASVLIRIYTQLDLLDKAQALSDAVLPRSIEALGNEHPLTVGIRFSVAKMHQRNGQPQQALDALQPILDHDLIPSDSPQYISVQNHLGDLKAELGDIAAADEHKQNALSAAIRMTGADSQRTVLQRLKSARFYVQNGKSELAQVLLQQANESIAKNSLSDAAITEELEQLNALIEQQ